MTRRCRSGHAITAGFVSLSLAAVLSACSTDPGEAAPSSTAAEAPPALDGRSLPPWPAPTDVAARVASAGLDLGPMGMAEHNHPHLRIMINGREVPVPADIGVDPASGSMSAVHTHTADGTIHIEAPTAGAVFTLGQLFTEWGVTLTAPDRRCAGRSGAAGDGHEQRQGGRG